MTDLKDGDEGFTLIELMVVVVILAILIAVAIPTLMGARGRSQDRAAQSAIRNTLTLANVVFTDNEAYDTVDSTQLAADEPSIEFVGAAASTEPIEVSTSTACVGTCVPGSKHNRFVAAARSETGKCWFGQAVAVSGVTNAGIKWEVADDVDCEAANAPAYDSISAPAAWASNPSLAD